METITKTNQVKEVKNTTFLMRMSKKQKLRYKALAKENNTTLTQLIERALERI
jgi:hypothetical protein